MLVERRRELRRDVRSRIRGGRTEGPEVTGDLVEASDAQIQYDIEFALLQMRGDTVALIDQALVRLDLGAYGSCFECDADISERRLRALPFAVRCQTCQERRESEQRRSRQLAHRRDSSLFPDLARP